MRVLRQTKERLEVEAHLFEARQRDEQRRLEFERRREEAEAAKIAQQRQTAALERQDRTRQLQDQMRRDSDRQMQSTQLSALHRASIEQQAYRNAAIRHARFSAQQAALDDALSHFTKPTPEPQPAPELDDEDAARWHRTWFK